MGVLVWRSFGGSSFGEPELETGSPETLRSFALEGDGTDWHVAKASHGMGSGGLITEQKKERGA